MSRKSSKESKLRRYLKASIRILLKARDFYMKSVTEYSDRIGYYGTVMGYPTGQVNTFPSSTKSGNFDHDLRELIRAASTRSLGNKVQLELLKRQQAKQSSKATGAHYMPRCHSVGNSGLGGLTKTSLASLKKKSMANFMFSQEAGAMLLQGEKVIFSK